MPGQREPQSWAAGIKALYQRAKSRFSAAFHEGG